MAALFSRFWLAVFPFGCSCEISKGMERDRMKKKLPVICAGIGGAMIGHWSWYLDTAMGCLFFVLGIILFMGSWITEARNKKDKEE